MYGEVQSLNEELNSIFMCCGSHLGSLEHADDIIRRYSPEPQAHDGNSASITKTIFLCKTYLKKLRINVCLLCYFKNVQESFIVPSVIHVCYTFDIFSQ